MHKGRHRIASEWSWQTVLLSSVFLFFQVHDLGRNLGSLLSWRWMCWCRRSSISLGFAESSWQGNHEETSPSQITCNGQLEIFHFFYLSVSLYLSLSSLCGHIIVRLLLFFLSLPILCFHSDLQEEYTTLLSIQAAFLHLFSNAWRRNERGTRKGSSLGIQNHDQLFVIPAEYKESYKLSP